VRVAIVGSRDYPHRARVKQYVVLLPSDTIVVSGGARGPDTWAVEAATARGMYPLVYRADWENLGRRAGFMRNQQIVETADRIVAFWDGESKGTKHTIDLARKAGKSVEVITP
jgi:hypothetical protein